MPITSDNRLIIPPAIFGDGSDGNVTISSNTTLSREMFYENLTINSGINLSTNSFRICVRGKLNNFGTIRNNGSDGSGTSGGTDTTNPSTYLFGTNQNGGAGSTGNSAGSAPTTTIITPVPGPDCRGGAGGGTSTTPYSGGASGSTSGTFPSSARIYGPASLFVSYYSNGTYNIGTSGGGGSAEVSSTGGGGGSRGGLVLIYTDILNNFGSIEAKGGTGAAGSGINAGGGGGGGGGIIIIISRLIMDAGTITAAGGSGGSKVGTGSNGTAGSNGLIHKITPY